MALGFRGVLSFRNGNNSKYAYIFNRDGAGKFSLAASPVVDIDQAQPYIEIATGVKTHLQFAVDTGATNLGQAYFGTLATDGPVTCSGGILEITEATGLKKLFIVETGLGFYNGTDKLFFALNCLPGYVR